VIALVGHGGYAQYALAPADRVFPIPRRAGRTGAALALLIQGLTAWHLYRTCARMTGGESVLVVSGAGGVGSLAVQLAMPLGAGRVIATASSAEQARAVPRARRRRRDRRRPRRCRRAARAHPRRNDGREVDVVLEMAGGPLFDVALRAMADMGRMVVYGISSREQNEVRTGPPAQALPGRHRLSGCFTTSSAPSTCASRWPSCSRWRRPATSARWWRDLHVERGTPRAGRIWWPARTRGKLLLDPSG